MAALTLADLLLKLITEWNSITKPRQRDLLRLCAGKAGQLESTHLTFIRSLSQARDLVYKAERDKGRTNDDLNGILREMEDLRREGRQLRLANYEQATTYAFGISTNNKSVLRHVPNEIVEAVKSMMFAYAEYFESEKSYDHELARVFRYLEFALQKVTEDADSSSEVWKNSLAKIDQAVSTIEKSWIRFSGAYARALVVFGDHGVTLDQTKPTGAGARQD